MGHENNPMETEAFKIVELALSSSEIPDSIYIVRDFDESLRMYVDPSKVALAIRKLVDNAVEAMGDGGELHISLAGSDESVEIRVADSGAGIPSEVEECIFEPFVSGMKQGKGLGVPTAKMIVESHGGAISFVTEIGEGTTFTLSFPRPSVDT
jgi:signal transduction histidine kinase